MEFFKKYKDHILLSALALYVILLGIGVIAELFDIQSILNWPIYKF
jgi:hypothetical protein